MTIHNSKYVLWNCFIKKSGKNLLVDNSKLAKNGNVLFNIQLVC